MVTTLLSFLLSRIRGVFTLSTFATLPVSGLPLFCRVSWERTAFEDSFEYH